MADVARLRYITEHYNDLQGLRLVPAGIALVAWGMAHALGLFDTHRIGMVVGVQATLLTAALFSFRIGSYYQRRYGVVETRSSTLSLSWFALILMCSGVPSGQGLIPVWSMAFIWGVACVIRGTRHDGLLRHYLVIAGGCFLVAGFELLGLSHGGSDGSLTIMAGFAVMIAGFGDDLVLRRTLTPPRTEDYGRTV